MPLLLLALGLLAGPPPTGTLEISSAAYGAEVAVDRRPVGRVPLPPQTVPAGMHLVEVLRDGQAAWSRVVFVGPGETVSLVVELAPREGPAPVLGDLRRAPIEPPSTPMRYRLAGTVAAEGALAGDAWDLDLVQRWRLDAEAGEVVSGAVEARAVGDMAGAGRDLGRVVHRGDDPPLLVESLWLRARGAGLDGRLGRMAQAGPAGRAFLMDGARVDGQLGAFEVHARGGRRWAVLTPRPDDPWLGGGGVAWGDRDRGVRLDGLYHQRLHLDASAFVAGAAGRLRLAGAAIGSDPSRASLTGRTALRRFAIDDIRGAIEWRGAVEGPLDLTVEPLGLTELKVPAGWTGRLGATLDLAPARVTVDGGLYAGAGAPSAGRPDRGWLDLGATLGGGRRGITLRLGGLVADPGEHPAVAALVDRAHGALGGWLGRGRWRLSAEVGVEQITLDGPDGALRRRLPVGGLRAALALTEALSLLADVEAAAAHPSLHPTGGPLGRARLGLRLR